MNGAPYAADGGIPPLREGDRLTRAEFERRYEAMPDVRKAELIEGVVFMPSPVRARQHGRPDSHLMCWLGHYEAHTPGVESAHNTTVRLDPDNEPQPDAQLFIDPARGGQVRIGADDYITGAPELAAEVAASSVRLDLGPRMEAYRRNGVREYVVWRVLDRQIDWFVLRDAAFERLAADDRGRYRSTVFPGLWLDPAALVAGDLLGVFAGVAEGVATPEHAAFVARLAAAVP